MCYQPPLGPLIMQSHVLVSYMERILLCNYKARGPDIWRSGDLVSVLCCARFPDSKSLLGTTPLGSEFVQDTGHYYLHFFLDTPSLFAAVLSCVGLHLYLYVDNFVLRLDIIRRTPSKRSRLLHARSSLI